MPRLAGQIDVSKNEAILDAALEVMGERGLSTSLEEVARRAGVSKQTIYNQFGSKADLVRAMSERRVHEITAALTAPETAENPAEALAGFARALLQAVYWNKGSSVFRAAILHAHDMPDIARAMWEAGPKASRARLAGFLALETAAGRLSCPDPQEAAEFFGGMVSGTCQTAMLLRIDLNLDDARIDHIAREAAMRFLRAYAA